MNQTSNKANWQLILGTILGLLLVEAVRRSIMAQVKKQDTIHIQAYDINKLINQQKRSNQAYLEFLRENSMSMGLYHLKVNAIDRQSPHSEDEVYYVISGAAKINVDGEDHPVQAGSIVFVESGMPHRFHSITQDLTVLVFFAPAEGTL